MRLVQAHGSFAWATCRKCQYKVRGEKIFDHLRQKRVAYCKACIKRIAAEEEATKKKAKPKKTKKPRFDDSDGSDVDDNIPQPGVMKPDITFFGEKLSNDFFDRFLDRDIEHTDLVIAIGTSLKVAPVSEMPHHIPHRIPHIWINRDPINHIEFDIQLLGDADTVVHELCRKAGWKLEHEMIPKGFRARAEQMDGSEHVWILKKDDNEEAKIIDPSA